MSKHTTTKFGKITKLLSGLEDAIGKTVCSIVEESVRHDYYKVIRFTDQTALIYLDTSESYPAGQTLDQGYTSEDEALVHFGLLSEEQFDAKRLEKEKAERQQNELREQREYERLKAKFGSPK